MFFNMKNNKYLLYKNSEIKVLYSEDNDKVYLARGFAPSQINVSLSEEYKIALSQNVV